MLRGDIGQVVCGEGSKNPSHARGASILIEGLLCDKHTSVSSIRDAILLNNFTDEKLRLQEVELLAKGHKLRSGRAGM